MDFKSKRKYIEPTLYTIVCLLYLLRQILFGSFSLPGRALYGLYFLWSMYYFVKVVFKMYYPPYIKVLNILVALILIYGIPLLIYGTDATWLRRTQSGHFLNVYFESILPIYSFYYFGKEQLIDDNWFRIITLFFFFVVYILYDHERIERMEKVTNVDQEDFTNNSAYLWLSLFPVMVFFKRKPLIQYLGVLIMMFFIILGFKRGAILLGVICFLVLLWQTIQTSKLSNKIVVVIVVGAVLVFFVPMIEDLLVNNDYFAERVDRTLEGDSSERDVLYPMFWSYYCNQSSLLALLFGNGAYGSIKLLGWIAHNDWLEFLINMGLVGTVVYLVYWIQIIIMCRKSVRICPPEVFQGILFFVIVYLGRTIFSASIMDMSFFATSVFGYLVAQYDNCLNDKNMMKKSYDHE